MLTCLLYVFLSCLNLPSFANLLGLVELEYVFALKVKSLWRTFLVLGSTGEAHAN